MHVTFTHSIHIWYAIVNYFLFFSFSSFLFLFFPIHSLHNCFPVLMILMLLLILLFLLLSIMQHNTTDTHTVTLIQFSHLIELYKCTSAWSQWRTQNEWKKKRTHVYMHEWNFHQSVWITHVWHILSLALTERYRAVASLYYIVTNISKSNTQRGWTKPFTYNIQAYRPRLLQKNCINALARNLYLSIEFENFTATTTNNTYIHCVECIDVGMCACTQLFVLRSSANSDCFAPRKICILKLYKAVRTYYVYEENEEIE